MILPLAGIQQAYSGRRIVILGSNGFIGRWVARLLQPVDTTLYLVVRNRATARVFADFGIEGQIIQLDLRETHTIRQAIKEITPHIIFNLAGYGVDRSEEDEEAFYTINFQAVKTICEVMAELGPDRAWSGQQIVHAGTALEYGKIIGDLVETSLPQPTTVYGRSKLLGTLALKRCCDTSNLRALTSRLFTVYGPGEHDGRLLPSLLDAAAHKRAVPLTSGTQKRDFTYIEDVAEGLLRLGVSSARPGAIVNLATGRLTTVETFVQKAAQILEIASEHLRFGALRTRPEEMNHAQVNIECLRSLTGWVPSILIGDAISKTVRFHTLTSTSTG